MKKIVKTLKKANKIALFSHVSPDPDTIGSTMAIYYALKSLKKEVFLFCDDKNMDKFKFLNAGNFIMTEDSSDTYNESRVASWVKLKDRKTDKTLVMVNAHLATEASRQVTSCQKIMDLVKQQNADGYLVCGDFNFSMSSNETCYNMMLGDGGKDVAVAAATEGVQKYTGGTFHNFGKVQNPKRIDFFFGSGSIQSNLYSIVKDTYEGYYPSDHYGILTYVTINK